MTWTPAHLTREQMEERRLKGAQLLKAGKLSHAEIARQLDVSRAAVTQWAQQLEAGEPLQRRVAPGRPMNQPFLETFFAYARWATRVIIEVCAELSQDEFVRPLTIGPGSLERTINHLIGAMFFFADRLNRQPVRPRLEKDGRTKTAAELLTLFEQAEREFGEAVTHTIRTHAMTDILNWTGSDDGPIDPEDQIPYALPSRR